MIDASVVRISRNTRSSRQFVSSYMVSKKTITIMSMHCFVLNVKVQMLIVSDRIVDSLRGTTTSECG